MNEEFQRELLSILRAMKDGAPDAWGVLVQQRVTYALVHAALFLIAAGACAIMVRRCWRMAAPELRKNILQQQEGPLFAGAIFALAFCAGGIACGCLGCSWLAEAVAPLGRVMERLR